MASTSFSTWRLETNQQLAVWSTFNVERKTVLSRFTSAATEMEEASAISATTVSTATSTAVAAQETVLKYSATLEKFSTDSVAIFSQFQTASTEKMLAFNASITGRIETILNPLLTTTLDTMLDAELSTHLTRVDERLAEAIVNSRFDTR